MPTGVPPRPASPPHRAGPRRSPCRQFRPKPGRRLRSCRPAADRRAGLTARHRRTAARCAANTAARRQRQADAEVPSLRASGAAEPGDRRPVKQSLILRNSASRRPIRARLRPAGAKGGPWVARSEARPPAHRHRRSAASAVNPAALARSAVFAPTHQAVPGKSARNRPALATPAAEVKIIALNGPAGKVGQRNSTAIRGATTGRTRPPKRAIRASVVRVASGSGRVTRTGTAGPVAASLVDCLPMTKVLPAMHPSRNGGHGPDPDPSWHRKQLR